DPDVVIPPDTHGAVGIDKVMSVHNSNYRIQNKADGAVISTVAISTFWSATGAIDPFDPRATYDPYNDRWILSAASEAGSANSSVLIGVSQTSDPTGSWYLFRFDTDSGNTLWADFPTLGFNKNWVVVGVNMFGINNGMFSQTRLFVVDYPSLRAGTGTGT